MLKYLDIYLPIALLVLSALLRLLIDRQVGKQEFIETLCEVPVDLIFLAMSFILAFIVAKPNLERQATGLSTLILFVILSFVIALLRRRTINDASSPNWRWAARLTLNFLLSLTALVSSIIILKDNSKVYKAEPCKHKTEQMDEKKQNA